MNRPNPRHRPQRPRQGRRVDARKARREATSRLGRFRQASRLAVGATGLLILLFGGLGLSAPDAGLAEPATETRQADAQAADTAAVDPDTVGADTAAGPPLDSVAENPGAGAREATGTLRALAITAYNALPALVIALLLLVVAGLLAHALRIGFRAVLSSWERAEAIGALSAILVWLIALGAALSVVAGDARALFGSIGLFGLALSWALQTPIESFTGWLLNSFRGYYRVGDRIAVGSVFGDVARIDFLTTTVFEAGGADKAVQAAQSTGALITFPNSEILRSNVTNYTRDFPYVYDELTVAVANESDIALASDVIERVAYRVIGERMEDAAQAYAELLRRARLAWDVATEPEVYVAARESWTELTVRYLVPVREMRKWSSRLQRALNEALADPEVAERVHTAYNRTQVQAMPTPDWARSDTDDRNE